MNKTMQSLLAIAFASLLAVNAQAGEDKHDHMMGHDSGRMMDSETMDHDSGKMGHDGDMEHMSMGDMFLEKRRIDGYTVSFHVMQAQDGMHHGGSHNLMIKVEKNGKALNDVTINSKVVDPAGEAESKMLMRMGDWYMAGYDLDHKGRYQLMILFKTADGAKHKGGVYYPGK